MFVAVVGPTASGKSEVAIPLARFFGVDVVSADSVQVYRGMDIGTAKPSATERAHVTHHLVDIAEPEDDFTVGHFQAAGQAVLDELDEGDPVRAVIAGGSGLHFRSLIDPLEFPPSDVTVRAEIDALPAEAQTAELIAADPTAPDHVDLANPRRVARAVEILRLTGDTPSERGTGEAAAQVRGYVPRVPVAIVGFDPGDQLTVRVRSRFTSMLADGLLDEVERLAPRLGRNAAQAVGYRQLLPVVAGDRTVEVGTEEAIRATTALAKRQRTFFGRDPRIVWLPWSDEVDDRLAAAVAVIEERL